jgi:enoyl-CoA hydratase/carnithine racemase
LDGLKQLVDLVGPSVAKDVLFSARRLQSDDALRIGLVNRVVGAEEAWPRWVRSTPISPRSRSTWPRRRAA